MFPGQFTPTLAWTSAQFDVQTAADKAQWVAPFRCKIDRVFVVAYDGATDAGGATVKFDGVTAGTSTRGDGDVGVITIPASSVESKYLYENPVTEVVLNPGAQVIVEVTAEGVAALLVSAGILYHEVPETILNATAAVAA